jgi:four helix bundle protein
MSSFKELDIYKMAFELSIEIHKLSLLLPQFELYEQGSQIRRSSKSIKDSIVEGYGRRRYKQDFIKFLVYAHSSCDETISHLSTIVQLYPEISEFKDYLSKYDHLGRKINKFITYVEENWNNISEPDSLIGYKS